MSDRGVPEEAGAGFDWETAEDLTSLTEQDLKAHLAALVEEERAVSYRRRIIQGRIDLLRVELVRRGEAMLSPEELARVLMGDAPAGREEA